jgi:hypothetical protein
MPGPLARGPAFLGNRDQVVSVFISVMRSRTMLRATLLAAAVLGATSARAAGERVKLEVDASEAEAVLAIMKRRAEGLEIRAQDWANLFATEPYRRLERRETSMGRAMNQDEFKAFVLSPELAARAADLERTVRTWKAADLPAAARKVMPYLPPQAHIRARVYPVIKPRTNSFVFEARTDPAIFLYVDPALPVERFANTVAHELHHIGLASVSHEAESALDALPPRTRAAAQWMGAFGEGVAMLAAAGGPEVHPHLHSPDADRQRWDRDVAALERDQRLLEQFLLDVIDGRLEGDAVGEKAFSFFGEQGPWYTVGWSMAVAIERSAGRDALVACMSDPRRLLVEYNRAVAGTRATPWSARLIEAMGAK